MRKTINTPIGLEKLSEIIDSKDIIALDTETHGKGFDREIVGYSIGVEKTEGCFPKQCQTWYVPLTHEAWNLFERGAANAPFEQAMDIIRKLVTDLNKTVVCHNACYEMKTFRNTGIDPLAWQCKVHDTQIQHWLLNCRRLERHKLDAVIYKFYKVSMMTYSQVTKGYKSFREVPLGPATKYACGDVQYLIPLYRKFMKDIEDDPKIFKDYMELELPLINVIEEMENNGIFVDVANLREARKILVTEQESIEKEIFSMLPRGQHRSVKLSSTQWLARVFINELHWWGLDPEWSPGANGFYSTGEKVLLEWAAGKHGTTEEGVIVANKLLRYRKLDKLASTYTTSLAELVDDGKRLHSSFNQCGTETGRFSSSDPNLQNIPRPQDGLPSTRKTFKHSDNLELVSKYTVMDTINKTLMPSGSIVGVDGTSHTFGTDTVLIAADYSQVELRIMAHMCQDPVMMEIYQNNGDIHQATADAVGCTRQAAKAINFGLIYGMGPNKLMGEINASFEEAAKFHAKYFRKYPNVKVYHDYVIQYVKAHGFVRTLLGRKRHFENVNSKEFWLASREERAAINSTIQGSAADIIKVAMRNVHRRFEKEGWLRRDAFMLVQVHDELLFEVDKRKAEEVSAAIKYEMENAVKLRVPLLAEPSIGLTWEDCK